LQHCPGLKDMKSSGLKKKAPLQSVLALD